MEFLKPVEIGFRRFLVRLLGVLVKRSRPLPPGFDFSTRKYLFVRQDRIGDVLVSTPLIHALKARYPNACVDFLLSSNNYFVLENEPLVRKRWIYRKTLSSAISILRKVRNEHYDFVIDLMDNPSATSTVLCALAGGAWNVGLSKENSYTYDLTVPLLSRKDTHIVDRLAMLLTVFGMDIQNLDLKVHYAPSSESRASVAKFLKENRALRQQLIGVNISPGEGTRFWSVENYQALVSWLTKEYPYSRILILYQPSDRAVAGAIAAPSADALLSPETRTFDQFAALVQSLWILITPDTSAVHLAAAFSVPSVVMYVQSNKELRIWEPYGSLSECVVTDVDDLRRITQGEVFDAVHRLAARLAESPKRASQLTEPSARAIRVTSSHVFSVRTLSIRSCD
jgi:ADP-heptose:LPS heptosyltransferase